MLKRFTFTPSLSFINFSRLYSSIMKIGTHDGTFHCDEALACFMLTQLPEYKDAEIVRTRNTQKLIECDIVVDVGGIFDHTTKRYDHHQREFNETLSSLKPEMGDSNKYKIRLSSAGLIYTYYGDKVIKQLTPTELCPEDLKVIFKKVYEKCIQEIDAIDNGVPMTEEQPKYKIGSHISSRVGRLNPEWNSKESVCRDTRFKNAMGLVGEELKYHIYYYTSVWLPARDLVKSSIEDRMRVHKSGKIVELSEFVPWAEHLFELEDEMGLGNDLKYVIFKDLTQSWRVQAVPDYFGSFILRKPLKKSWWGVRDDMLSDIAGIQGCIFCHSTGFIGGNRTREGALEMAIASLED